MTTVTLKGIADITWHNVQAIAYDHATVKLHRSALATVQDGRERFQSALDAGLPCYGVSTGLGKFVAQRVADPDDREFVISTLRARAAASGPPLPRAVARSAMVLKLTNFLSGMDGVRPTLCEYMADRLNDGLTPWIPTYGHGMAADATANSHVFQTLAGEGFVWGAEGERRAASEALAQLGVAAYVPDRKEALALINGIAAAPAYAIDAHRRLHTLLASANAIAAMSMISAALPLDSIAPAVADASAIPGIASVLERLQNVARGQAYRPHTLQAPVSFRVVPQVHGAFASALDDLRSRVEDCFSSFSDNPMLTKDGAGELRFLSVGVFHNQHLVNQIDHVALALAHVAGLSERRLHRLLDTQVTGLAPQLATEPGVHAGLVVAHKAALDFVARLKVLAQPVSLHTGESSGGQEDYMSMAIPAIHRLYQMVYLTQQTLAYEFLAVLVALDHRPPSDATPASELYASGRRTVDRMSGDRAPGPDAEALFDLLESEDWQVLCRHD